MGLIRNATYLIPTVIGERLHDRALSSLVTDLAGSGAVVAPIVVVVGTQLELPYTPYSDLGNVLLDGAAPPSGMLVAYRGSDARAAVDALGSRGDRDAVICFADVRPFFDDLPPERAHPVFLFALAAPRELVLHLPAVDDEFREIPGTAERVYRACNVAVVHGTDLDGPKYRPVSAIAQIVERHLGPLATQFDLL